MMTSAPRAAWILCVEPALEKQATLLVRSIRRFAGRLKGLPVYSFSPRGKGISPAVARELAALSVIHSKELLNLEMPRYALANKPFVCARAQQTIDAEYLIWIDSDTVVFDEPGELLYSGKAPMAAKVVSVVNIGVKSLEGTSANQQFWRSLYRLCGVGQQRFVRSNVEDYTLLEYFNSGLVSTRRDSELFSKWAENFRAAIRAGVAPDNPYFIEQATLSATASAYAEAPVQLPLRYNYPARLHAKLQAEDQLRSLDQITMLHYPFDFTQANAGAQLSDMKWLRSEGERHAWLMQNLTELSSRSDAADRM